MSKVKTFYTGKAWRELSFGEKVRRGGKCERCGFTAVSREDWKYLIGHHKIELNESNVDDARVSLNPENI